MPNMTDNQRNENETPFFLHIKWTKICKQADPDSLEMKYLGPKSQCFKGKTWINGTHEDDISQMEGIPSHSLRKDPGTFPPLHICFWHMPAWKASFLSSLLSSLLSSPLFFSLFPSSFLS